MYDRPSYKRDAGDARDGRLQEDSALYAPLTGPDDGIFVRFFMQGIYGSVNGRLVHGWAISSDHLRSTGSTRCQDAEYIC
jgi:hypothetical protein